MDNGKHPSLNRIINQINENKDELVKPENSIKSLIDSSVGEAPPKPVEDVRDFFTEEDLQKRQLEIEAEEAGLDKEELFAPDVLAMISADAGYGSSGGDSNANPDPANEKKDSENYDAFSENAGQPLPPEVQEYLDSEKEEYSFGSVYDLRDFFKKNKSEFEEWAHPAIDSILSAVSTIGNGCKCKLDQRKRMVEDYYVEFVKQNQHTSLMTKMMEILKTKKLKFYSRDNLFLEFPTPEQE